MKISVLFSQFLLTLSYTNNFIPYLFIFLTISDHQQEQETRILVSSTATKCLHLRIIVLFQTNIRLAIPKDFWRLHPIPTS